MHHIYGLKPEQSDFQKRAAALASGVLNEYAADVTEELAQGCCSTAMIYAMHVAAAQAVASSTPSRYTTHARHGRRP